MKYSIKNSENCPLVSIIMTFYNSNLTLSDAIASLLFQTYKNWELIFIDDGSKQDPSPIIEKFHDLNINYIKLDKNFGRGYAYQKGIDNAEGEFVMFLDADDWWYSNKIEEQIAYMLNNSKINVLGTGIISAQNNTPKSIRANKEINNTKLISLIDPPLAFASVCIRRKILCNYYFDDRLTVAQDIDFLQNLLMKEYFSNLSNELYVYNEYGSFKKSKMSLAWKNRILSLIKFRRKYPIAFLKHYMTIKFKSYLYNLFFLFGIENLILSHRGKKLSIEQSKVFKNEYSKLIKTKEKYFV